jgi:hypothetical protein
VPQQARCIGERAAQFLAAYLPGDPDQPRRRQSSNWPFYGAAETLNLLERLPQGTADEKEHYQNYDQHGDGVHGYRYNFENSN